MLDQLHRRPGSRRPQRRVGRGKGSGHGKTCGRGQKGAGARSGSKRRSWMEGGQMPLSRRLPKVGFTNLFRRERQIVNLCELGSFEKNSRVDAAALCEAGLIARVDRPVKVLGNGELSVALQLRVDAISASARKKIEGAGGSVELGPAERVKAEETQA